MTRTTVASAISITITISFLAACTSSQRGPDSEEMYVKASALTKLSAAVESTVRYKSPPPDLGDGFRGYKLRVLRQERHSVVLVCDAAGTRALLEDAGCSGPMDRERWMGKAEACEFSIDTKQVCGGN